jgi:hypothetical protein
LIDCLESNEKVIINDPRLCNYDTFGRYMELFEDNVVKDDILIVLFENNLKFSLENIGKKNSKKSIVYYSKIYNIDNYKKYNYIINGN